MTDRLVGTLRGKAASWGSITAGDLARLLAGVELAVARAAGHVLGRPIRRGGGRRPGDVASASRLVLLTIHEGNSLVVEFAPSVSGPFEDGFEFDVESLAEASIVAAIETASGDDTTRTDVAAAFAEMLSQLDVGGRFDEVAFSFRTGSEPPRAVSLKQADRARLAEAIARGPDDRRAQRMPAVLVAADFEQHLGKARGQTGEAFNVRFDPRLDDAVQTSLRSLVELVGEAEVDSLTGQVSTMDVHEVSGQTSLWRPEEGHAFWDNRPLERLMANADLLPATDIDGLSIEVTEEELVDFLETV